MTAAVPDEILLLIFDLLSGPACLQFPDAKYDYDRACAPFVLASVCRQWRLLAQSTCTLWTYFGFSDDSDYHESDLARLHTIVPLVKLAPIDLLFGCDSLFLYPDTKQLLDELMCLIPQWRSAQLDMPRRGAGLFTDRSPLAAPILQQLSITAEECTLCLPEAHQLIRVHLDCQDVVLSDPLSLWPNISNWCSILHGNRSTRFCTAYALQLVELFLVENYWLSDTLDLPCLLTLLLNDARDLNHIRAPKLRNLILKADNLQKNGADLTCHSTGVQHLTLYGTIGIQTIKALEHLAAVSTISFTVPTNVRKVYNFARHTCVVDAGFFHQLAVTRPPVWPYLKHISFAPDLERLDFNELLAFIESRNLRVEEDVQGGHCSSIQDVTVDALNIETPVWFVTQLQALLTVDRR
ncbi:hypothetical protein BKA62DRAFT_697554 [Auriculariales sp. MPI-PUGE-AT-0066]|nr:hypothetical protein BKA62DRAFT_697554 [Auriculariales sp. MPI-PUGE-AT-0066]